MAHEKYTTEAIVLHRVETGEADVTLWLLTESLGLIVARAQSARARNAKMRPHVQSLAHMRATLVRGKHVWRLTGTESVQGNSLDTKWHTTIGLTTFAHIASFVRRMTLDDTPIDIFETVRTVRNQLTHTHDKQEAEQLELHAIAEMLVTLGHLPAAALATPIKERELAHAVNTALAESQL